MRKISFEALITKSINRTKFILFKPFSLKKWFCLLLIGYLAGVIGGGGNFRLPAEHDSEEAEAVEQDYILDSYEEQTAEGENNDQLLDGWTAGRTCSLKDRFCPLSSGIAIGAIGILGLFILFCVVFFTWLSSRFKFIWFNAIVSNDASIKEPFQRYKKEGNSLFKFFLVLGFLTLVFIGLLIFWVYSNGVSAGVFEKGVDLSITQILNIFALPVLVLIVGIAVLVLLNVLIEHFVITIMAMESRSFLDALKKTLNIVSNNKKDIFLYYLVLLGLGIVIVILSVLIALACIIVVLIIAGLLLGLPYLLIVTLFKAKLLYIIFAIVVGLPLLIASILLFMSIGLPFAVFFRSFSLYFMSSLECGYSPLSLEDIA